MVAESQPSTPRPQMATWRSPLAPTEASRHLGARRQNTPEPVTASEIAGFVFRAEAWKLAQMGRESANLVVRRPGMARHTPKAAAGIRVHPDPVTQATHGP